MHHMIGRMTVIILTALAAAHWQPLAAQTSRQAQVAAERAKTAGAEKKACPLLTNAEIRKVTGRNQPWELNDEPYDMGSACDYGGVVTLRVFSGPKPEDEVNWTLKNYKKENEKKTPISGFGAGAYIMFPTPRDKYEDVVAVLVGKAGQRMFMISLTAPKGKPAESVQPQLVTLANTVVARLR